MEDVLEKSYEHLVLLWYHRRGRSIWPTYKGEGGGRVYMDDVSGVWHVFPSL